MLNYKKKGMMLNDRDIVLIIVKMTKKVYFYVIMAHSVSEINPLYQKKMQRTMFAVDTIQLTFNCLKSTTETL